MIALLAAVALTTPAPQNAAPSAPLREVVYHVSYTRHERLSQGSFGGGANPDPVVQGADDSDEGTITVDVMAVANDTLGIRLLESWNQHPRPATYLGNVGPDGSLHFGDQPISEVSTDVLPMFGAQWMHGQPVDAGVKWTTKYADRAVNETQQFEITSFDGLEVTVKEFFSLTVQSARGIGGVTTGSVVYKPSLLVPISGKVERRSSSGDADTADVDSIVINFSRVSDTLDPPK